MNTKIRALIPLANGFEELEAITLSDLFARAGMEVTTAGLEEGVITAARGARLIPDTSVDTVVNEDFDLLVLPGGLPGADHLMNDPRVQSMIKRQHQQGKYLAAICAAPRALVAAGVTRGKTITCYPGALDAMELDAVTLVDEAVVVDGHLVTSRGPGTAIRFALQLIALLLGTEQAARVEQGLVI